MNVYPLRFFIEDSFILTCLEEFGKDTGGSSTWRAFLKERMNGHVIVYDRCGDPFVLVHNDVELVEVKLLTS